MKNFALIFLCAISLNIADEQQLLTPIDEHLLTGRNRDRDIPTLYDINRERLEKKQRKAEQYYYHYYYNKDYDCPEPYWELDPLPN